MITVGVRNWSYKLIFANKNNQMEANILWVIIKIRDADSG